MRITRLGHAALLVQTAAARVLIDPGTFSLDAAFTQTGLDAIVVTHQHPDHLDPERSPALVAANPQARLLADPETAAQQGGTWRAHRDGDVTTVGDLTLTAVGSEHARILPQIPVVANVGVLVSDGRARLFHPGDSYDSAPPDVDLLALPLSAPWAKVAETVAFLRTVGPREMLPIHDATIADPAYDIYWNHTVNHGGLERSRAHRLRVGESLVLSHT